LRWLFTYNFSSTDGHNLFLGNKQNDILVVIQNVYGEDSQDYKEMEKKFEEFEKSVGKISAEKVKAEENRQKKRYYSSDEGQYIHKAKVNAERIVDEFNKIQLGLEYRKRELEKLSSLNTNLNDSYGDITKAVKALYPHIAVIAMIQYFDKAPSMHLLQEKVMGITFRSRVAEQWRLIKAAVGSVLDPTNPDPNTLNRCITSLIGFVNKGDYCKGMRVNHRSCDKGRDDADFGKTWRNFRGQDKKWDAKSGYSEGSIQDKLSKLLLITKDEGKEEEGEEEHEGEGEGEGEKEGEGEGQGEGESQGGDTKYQEFQDIIKEFMKTPEFRHNIKKIFGQLGFLFLLKTLSNKPDNSNDVNVQTKFEELKTLVNQENHQEVTAVNDDEEPDPDWVEFTHPVYGTYYVHKTTKETTKLY
jgi:hypothetical protein